MRPQTGRSSGPMGPTLPSPLSRSGGARSQGKTSSSRTQKRRQRRQRHLQHLSTISVEKDAIRAVKKSLKGSCSRQRQRAEEWRRHQPTAPSRSRSQDEAQLPRSARQHEDPGTTMQPQTSQKQKIQLISLDKVTEPVVGQEKEWRMLNLGTPATPPVCRQEFELGNTVAVPS